MKHLKDLVSTTCINSSGKPNEIKQSEWVKKDQRYTIIATAKNKITNELMFQLAEISISNPEYWGYKATRFAISQEDLDKLNVHEEIVLEDIFEKELTTIE